MIPAGIQDNTLAGILEFKITWANTGIHQTYPALLSKLQTKSRCGVKIPGSSALLNVMHATQRNGPIQLGYPGGFPLSGTSLKTRQVVLRTLEQGRAKPSNLRVGVGHTEVA